MAPKGWEKHLQIFVKVAFYKTPLSFKYRRDSTALQYRVDTVIRVSSQRRRHNFIGLPPYFYFYTCSCRSSPFPGKALALRTDSNGLSDPKNDKRSVGIERVEERRRAKFSSSWPDRILSNFGVFAFVKTIYQRVRWNQ